MSELKINVTLLGRHAGTTINKGDRNYDTFAKWAKDKALRNGTLICEPTKAVKESNPETKLEDMKNTEILAMVTELDPETKFKGNTKKELLLDELARLKAEKEKAEKEKAEATPSPDSKDGKEGGEGSEETEAGTAGNEDTGEGEGSSEADGESSKGTERWHSR